MTSDLVAQPSWPQSPLHVAVTGSRGLVGSGLVPFLTTDGHRVTRLVRGRPAQPGEVGWSTEEGIADPARMEGVDAIVHLAAEIASSRDGAAIQRTNVEA